MNLYLILEIISTLSMLAYLYFILKDSIYGWYFSIPGLIIMIFMFFQSKLYVESFTNFIYLILTFYGIYQWKYKTNQIIEDKPIIIWPFYKHLIAIICCSFGTYFLGLYLSTHTDASFPFWDSFTSVFAIFTTYLVTLKVLENWIYWIILDFVTIFLYSCKNLYIYAALMIIYTIFAIWGFFIWKKIYQEEQIKLQQKNKVI